MTDEKYFAAWIHMEGGLDLAESDHQAHLEDAAEESGPEGQQLMKEFNLAADALVKGAQEPGSANVWECAKRAGFMLKEGFELLEEHLSITFGSEAMGMLHEAQERFWYLLEAIGRLDVAPSRRATAFLKRVSRCYLFGFDAECVVMCRSVLESEFDSVVSNDDCIDVFGMPNQRGPDGKPLFDLFSRMNVAKQKGRIDDQTADFAHAVRKEAKKVVHEWPKVKKTALPSIIRTCRVLTALQDEKN